MSQSINKIFENHNKLIAKYLFLDLEPIDFNPKTDVHNEVYNKRIY